MSKIGESLRALLPRFRGTESIASAAPLLKEVGAALDHPWAFWVAHLFELREEEEIDMARQIGWPENILSELHLRRYVLKSLLANRCRLELMPFVASLAEFDQADRDGRTIFRLCKDLGISSMVTIPLHLPKAQIGMLGWAGAAEIEETREVVDEIASDLMALGLTFANQMEKRWSVQPDPEDCPRLTGREQECIRYIASGAHVPEIAKSFGISETTVRYHVDNARRKLGATSQSHAVALAVQLGLLGPIDR